MAKKDPVQSVKAEIIPPKPNPAISSLIDLKIDLNDAVAIKLSEVERKLMAFEEDIGVKMTAVRKEMQDLQSAGQKILRDEAEKRYRATGETFAKAVEIFEDIKSSKVEIHVISADQYDWDDEHVPDEKKVIVVEIYVNKSPDQKGLNNMSYDRGLYRTRKSFPVPASFVETRKRIKEAKLREENLNKDLNKARTMLGKMNTLERHCKSELAKHRLQQEGRQDILDILKGVTIPGLDALELPAPKK